MYRKGKDIRKKKYQAAFVFGSFWFWGKVSNSWILNVIGRNFLLGSRRIIAKCLMRTFTCRSTFLYGKSKDYHTFNTVRQALPDWRPSWCWAGRPVQAGGRGGPPCSPCAGTWWDCSDRAGSAASAASVSSPLSLLAPELVWNKKKYKIAVLWFWIRTDLAVLDLDPYWECGSGSRSQCCGSMSFWGGSGSAPLTNGSGSWIQILLYSSLTFKMPAKNNF